ncbi:hypothetical protein AB0H83_45850 [Dactylosporangium sp. NPDC050688]|uniref:hypothetical protein n=1 Tax=Dactylosporangium sp. NPDC050688 TaxID=3157217 RepID=UPI00340808D8
MPARSSEPPTAADRSGDPDELIGSAEVARLLGYSRPDKLPQPLLDVADDTKYRDNGTVSQRQWRRGTVWRYQDTAAGAEIAGRPTVDRAGIAEQTGVSLPAVDNWIGNAASNGFPDPVAGRWLAEDVAAWHRAWLAAQRDALTTVDRSGDPDELVSMADAARIVGYASTESLNGSPILAYLMQHNEAADNETKPAGGTRYRWPRRVVWAAADARTARRGRRAGASRVIDRSGDPDELVNVDEAARVLGYRHKSGLPTKVLDLADIPKGPGQARRWKRSTLWSIDANA